MLTASLCGCGRKGWQH
ncbi:lipoprotein [Yoonia maritima]